MLTERTIQILQRVASEPNLSGTKYELRRLLGSGGMGNVYLVYDTDLEREVALKVLQIDLESDDAAEKLRAEARMLAHLDHPGIVAVYEVGLLADGQTYYTMKFVEGRRLDQALAIDASLPEKLRVFRQICATAGFAHSRGFVHLDLKPQNILVAPFGETLVVDWGIARGLHKRTLTGNLEAGGTPEFMAPEQLRSPAENIDSRADVFALGKILELLLRPRSNHNKASARPKVPAALLAICKKATSEAPDDRYHTATELMEEATRFLDLESVEAYRESYLEVVGRWLEKNKAMVYLVLAYLFMRLFVAVFFRN